MYKVNRDMRSNWTLRHPRMILSEASGQALTEAAIMLSLFAFTWMLISVANFMTNNQIRTAAASRHAAWMKGNGVNQSGSIDSQFFSGNGFSTYSEALEEIEEVPTVGPILSVFMNGSAYSVWHTEVGFGGPAVASQYPFILISPQYPFMRDTGSGELLSTFTECEWAEVNDAWGAGEGGLSGTVGLLMSVFGL